VTEVPVARAVPNVGLHVSSLGASLEFYRDLIGLTVRIDSGWVEDPSLLALTATPGGCIRIVNLATQADRGATITLVQVDGVRRRPQPRAEFHDPGTMHLAFEVDDLDAALARLSAAGVAAVAAPGEVSGGGAGHARVVFLRDPDGFFVDLVSKR
jgi:catechol 2,3-dioxygenase-like lactoylglutathione lyase family enzyme